MAKFQLCHKSECYLCCRGPLNKSKKSIKALPYSRTLCDCQTLAKPGTSPCLLNGLLKWVTLTIWNAWSIAWMKISFAKFWILNLLSPKKFDVMTALGIIMLYAFFSSPLALFLSFFNFSLCSHSTMVIIFVDLFLLESWLVNTYFQPYTWEYIQLPAKCLIFYCGYVCYSYDQALDLTMYSSLLYVVLCILYPWICDLVFFIVLKNMSFDRLLFWYCRIGYCVIITILYSFVILGKKL